LSLKVILPEYLIVYLSPEVILLEYLVYLSSEVIIPEYLIVYFSPEVILPDYLIVLRYSGRITSGDK
jgi:hypothetical protein